MAVFKTKIEPKESTKKELENWREPKHAYILFETRVNDQRKIDGVWVENKTTGIMAFNVQNRPDVGNKINFYIGKGYRIIHYGNFPTANSPRAEVQKHVRLHTGPDGRNPWDVLANTVEQAMGLNTFWQDEKNELLSQVEALKAKNASLEQGKTNAKKADSHASGI